LPLKLSDLFKSIHREYFDSIGTGGGEDDSRLWIFGGRRNWRSVPSGTLRTDGIVRTVVCTYANETADKSYRGRSGEGQANDSGEDDRFDGFGGGAEERSPHD
jgi:hypothetical protein